MSLIGHSGMGGTQFLSTITQEVVEIVGNCGLNYTSDVESSIGPAYGSIFDSVFSNLDESVMESEEWDDTPPIDKLLKMLMRSAKNKPTVAKEPDFTRLLICDGPEVVAVVVISVMGIASKDALDLNKSARWSFSYLDVEKNNKVVHQGDAVADRADLVEAVNGLQTVLERIQKDRGIEPAPTMPRGMPRGFPGALSSYVVGG